jgi:hypothetical protein
MNWRFKLKKLIELEFFFTMKFCTLIKLLSLDRLINIFFEEFNSLF